MSDTSNVPAAAFGPGQDVPGPAAGDPDRGPGGWKGVLLGLLLTLVLHVVGLVVVGSALDDHDGYKGLALMMFLGVVQLAWMLPAILVARMGGMRALSMGLIIGAAVTLLLNGTCWMIAAG